VIVRFTDDVRHVALSGTLPPEPPREESKFTVMTSWGPEEVPGERPRRLEFLPTLIKEDMPEWLRDALALGSHVVMTREDYAYLPEEIKAHADVISY